MGRKAPNYPKKDAVKTNPPPNPSKTNTYNIKKEKKPFIVDWVDSIQIIKNTKGELEEAGTVLNVCDTIVFLTPLSNNQLEEMKRIVNQAVDYELSKRSRN